MPERAGERTLDPETVRLSADALGRDARSVAGETVLRDSRARHPREYRRLRRSSYFRFGGHPTISDASKQQKPSRDYCRVPSRAWPQPPGLPFVHDPFFVFLEADCGVFLKYRPGVVPRVFRNIAIKALGVL